MLHIINYKKFPTLSLPLEKDLVITGKSGSGKTQIIWAYLLYFKGFNGQCSGKSYQPIYLRSVAPELLDPCLNGLRNHSSFLNCTNKNKNSVEFRGYLNNQQFNVTLVAGCNFVLTNGSSTSGERRIKFAHMGSSYSFNTLMTTPSDHITSNDNSLRYRYFALKYKSKTEIRDFMRNIFHIKVDNDTYDDRIFLNGHDIMFSSSSMQKIFASLVILYSLLESTKDDFAYYLMDDIEAGLEPDSVSILYNYLLGKCRSKGIKLIVTSKVISPIFIGDIQHIKL
jgi:hypothetical protein